MNAAETAEIQPSSLLQERKGYASGQHFKQSIFTGS